MIYFLRSGSDGPVKIGWTRNLERRLRHLQPGTPDRVEIIRTIEGERWMEGWLHKAFAASRRFGEWFEFHPDMLTIEPPSDKPGRTIGSRVAPSWAVNGRMLEVHLWLEPKHVQHLYRIAASEGRTISGQGSYMLKQVLIGLAARDPQSDKAA